MQYTKWKHLNQVYLVMMHSTTSNLVMWMDVTTKLIASEQEILNQVDHNCFLLIVEYKRRLQMRQIHEYIDEEGGKKVSSKDAICILRIKCVFLSRDEDGKFGGQKNATDPLYICRWHFHS